MFDNNTFDALDGKFFIYLMNISGVPLHILHMHLHAYFVFMCVSEHLRETFTYIYIHIETHSKNLIKQFFFNLLHQLVCVCDFRFRSRKKKWLKQVFVQYRSLLSIASTLNFICFSLFVHLNRTPDRIHDNFCCFYFLLQYTHNLLLHKVGYFALNLALFLIK